MSKQDKTPELAAQLRTQFGKGAARRTRRQGLIPAVLYGHGTDPVHLSLPEHETFLTLKGNPNALVKLNFDGREELALSRDVQRDLLKPVIEHVDLLLVKKGEKVTVEISVLIEGESAPDTIHTLEMQTIAVTAEALSIPEHLVASIEGLEDGDVVRAGDLTLPKGVELEQDPEEAIVLVTMPQIEPDEDEEEEAAAAAPAEADADADQE